MITEKFGSRLRKLRKEKGLTQTQLGDKVGLSKKSISYYEKSDSPPSTHLKEIAIALNVSTDELLGLKEIQKNKLSIDTNIIKKVKLIQSLPIKDQKAIFRLINSIANKNNSKEKVNAGI